MVNSDEQGKKVSCWLRGGWVLSMLAVVGSMTILVGFCWGAWASYGMWGYLFVRPGVDSRVVSARRVVSITQVATTPAGGWKLKFGRLPQPGRWSFLEERPLENLRRDGQADRYYCLEQRALVKFDPKLAATSAGTMQEARVGEVYALVEKTGLLEAGEPGYVDAKQLHGLVYELEGAGGEALMLVAARGGEVSDDHYPYYEVLFEGDGQGGWRLASTRRFYFDVAGMEGAEFPVLGVMFSGMGLWVTIPLALVIWLVMMMRERRKLFRGMEVCMSKPA
jgi:hypothetical protein